ncbi:MAG: sigma-54-dependent Fis family transcriptional regulator [Opitutaceae bacterium]|nr:sigma-54-dependent Fis family transcriptional regulator [Cytophagales bacterium]
MSFFKIFIAEDEKVYSSVLHYHLSLNPDYEVTVFKDGKSLMDNIHKKPDVISLDYSLPDTNALKLFKQIRLVMPDVPIIVISGQQDMQVAIEILKEGAYDYFIKNEDTKNKLWNAVVSIRSAHKPVENITKKEGKFDLTKVLIGSSAVMQKVVNLIEKAASTQINVSITGETGTGKEVVAKAIHLKSNRNTGPYVAVNVAAIPSELLESELFGHEKGAFTGALAKRTGKFEEAHKGTMFLDEIGELNFNLQAKLLRVLQEREVVRIGSNAPTKIDVRIITATHKNLAEEVKKGNFREDLYYRLQGFPIPLPPLRDRGNDLLILANHFLKEFCEENKLTGKVLTPIAKDKLKQYPFPGNVRELKSVIELSAVLSEGNNIDTDDIVLNSYNLVEDFLAFEMTLEGYNQKIIQYFLKKYDNNVVLTAQKLGVGKTTLYRMIQEKKL